MSRVDVSGVGIEYQVTGQGRPVVLLHGFPDSGRLWRHQVPALAGAGFQVIVPDLRGYGHSDKPEAVEAYSMTRLAGDVTAILADLGIGGPISSVTTGAPAWPGCSPPSCPAAWTTSSSCLSATRSPSAAPGAVPEVVVHAVVPVPRHRRTLADRRQLG